MSAHGIASQPKHRLADKKKQCHCTYTNYESVKIAGVNSFSKSINIFSIIADNHDGDNCPVKSHALQSKATI